MRVEAPASRRRIAARRLAQRAPPTWAIGLAGVLAGAAIVRLHLGLGEHGIYWPDEIYQSVEQAHRLVYGYGVVPWEFVRGIRSWAFPGLLASVLWAGKTVGLNDPDAYLALVRVVFVAVATLTTLGVFVLARTLGASRPSAVAGAAVFAFAAPIVYFGHRALSETASALPVVLGFALALAPDGRARRRGLLLAGASLLGLAALLRLHNAVFCAALLGILAGRRDWRACGDVAAVLAGWAFVLGLLDELTWGSWFHSAREYIEFSVFENGAEEGWGSSAWHYYARVLLTSMPALTILVGALTLIAWRRAPGLLVGCAVFLVLHALTPHKELRFLLPVAPLLCALAAVGLDVVGNRLDERVGRFAPLALILVALVSGLRAERLTFGDLGAYGGEKASASAWGDSAPLNRLLLVAYDREDLCGLKVESAHWAWTGGLSHLHRDVPYYPQSGPPRDSGLFNYVISGAGEQAGEIVARDSAHALVRIRTGCEPDPGFTGRL